MSVPECDTMDCFLRYVSYIYTAKSGFNYETSFYIRIYYVIIHQLL